MNFFLSVLEIFEDAGYEISEACVLSNSCFDFFARRGERLLLVKTLRNIDSLTDIQAEDIRTVAAMLGAAPVIVGERKTGEELQDGVVYLRHGIACVSKSTLKGALASEYPVLLCYRGGYYASIDGTLLKKLRQERGLSRPALAKLVGVSPKAIYEYEEGNAGATFETALKLEDALGEPIVKPLDIFKVPDAGSCARPPSSLEALQSLGFRVYPVRKAPFSALARGRDAVLMTKLARCCNRALAEKAKLLRSIASTVGRTAFILLNSGRAKNIAGVAAVSRRELQEMEDPNHLLELIEERTMQDPDVGG